MMNPAYSHTLPGLIVFTGRKVRRLCKGASATFVLNAIQAQQHKHTTEPLVRPPRQRLHQFSSVYSMQSSDFIPPAIPVMAKLLSSRAPVNHAQTTLVTRYIPSAT